MVSLRLPQGLIPLSNPNIRSPLGIKTTFFYAKSNTIQHYSLLGLLTQSIHALPRPSVGLVAPGPGLLQRSCQNFGVAAHFMLVPKVVEFSSIQKAAHTVAQVSLFCFRAKVITPIQEPSQSVCGSFLLHPVLVQLLVPETGNSWSFKSTSSCS